MAADRLDDHTLEELIDMAAETNEVECDDLDTDTDQAREARKQFDAFSKELHETLLRFAHNSPERILPKGVDPEEWVDSLDDATYNVYMTLSGAGVGIWDGRWDAYFAETSQASWRFVEAYLRNDLRLWVDITGGGKLNEALNEAALAGCPEDEDEDEDEDDAAPTQDVLNENIVIGDMRRGSGYGVGALGKAIKGNMPWDKAIEYANAWMQKNNVNLDIYYVNERGNVSLLSSDGTVIKSWT